MSPFEIFIRDCISRLRRIAASSNGDASVDDLKNEAWVMAHDWPERETPFDLTTPDDQESLLSELYRKFVGRMRTRIGLALRLDKDWEKSDEDAGPRLADKLVAHETADPIRELEQREEVSPLELACRRSYSQATAYAVCLHRWDSSLSLADYLGIKGGTLWGRIRYWKVWIEYQPSIFDGVAQISPDFTPLRRDRIPPAAQVYMDGEQHAWKF